MSHLLARAVLHLCHHHTSYIVDSVLAQTSVWAATYIVNCIGLMNGLTVQVKKKFKAMAKKPPRMSVEEKRIARSMHFEQGLTPTKVAKTLGRALSSITRLFAQKKAPKPVGRPRALSAKQIDTIIQKLEDMVDKAEATHEISMAMLMRRCRAKASARVVANALHERGYRFRDLRHKPILTPEDVKARFAWATKYKNKPAAWWAKAIHVHLDNHHFKVATTGAGRKLLAKRTVRGVYRTKGKALRAGHVKPHPKQNLSLGVKGFLKAGGVGAGKVLVWHTVDGLWSGDAAAHLYADVVRPALEKQFPAKRSFCILEDNDPTGSLSKEGVAAKVSAKLTELKIPKRSPDLNVLDYAVWSEVERRMRVQERSWPASKRESREQFGKRLDRTAKSLPAEFINKSIANLHERCQRLYTAKGGLFEEGGRARRPL